MDDEFHPRRIRHDTLDTVARAARPCRPFYRKQTINNQCIIVHHFASFFTPPPFDLFSANPFSSLHFPSASPSKTGQK